jgi:lysophospholipid acyltransferase (LPLAT)-like uncharacterized protein
VVWMLFCRCESLVVREIPRQARNDNLGRKQRRNSELLGRVANTHAVMVGDRFRNGDLWGRVVPLMKRSEIRGKNHTDDNGQPIGGVEEISDWRFEISNVGEAMIGWILRVAVTFIGGTLRWRIEDRAGLLEHTPERACIFVFWHNRIFLLPYLFRKHWHSRRRDEVAVLVSASKDGEFLTGVLSKFNLLCVRGSSSRRGKAALRELTRLMGEGYDVGITPDGPRGPRYYCHDGAVSLAQLTGAAIIPVSWDVSWKITVRSWDGFMVPLPFGRAVVRIGAPMWVGHEENDEQREAKRVELENVLREMAGVSTKSEIRNSKDDVGAS